MGYQQLATRESGFLPRVTMRSLRDLSIPPPPDRAASLAAALGEVLNDLNLAGEALHHVQLEAEEAATTDLPTVRGPGPGAFYSHKAVSNANWLPSATALRAEQMALDVEAGWVSLRDVALAGRQRTRLSPSNERIRVLRLGDIGDDCFVPWQGEEIQAQTSPARTLGEPLSAGEVLLSTLGSSFRTAYVDEGAPPNTYPVDSWARLRFRETPAAWALLFSTTSVRSQAARLTIGTVQQFVPAQALLSLRVPLAPRELRDRWQHAVDRHHTLRRALDRRWLELLSDCASLFETAHRAFRPRRLPPEVTT
jgi:hypothetical protein